MFILMLSLLGVVMDSRYSCDQYAQVGVAILSMTIIYFVDIVLFWLLVYMGWRGTPLNESKRMPQMAILGTCVQCMTERVEQSSEHGQMMKMMMSWPLSVVGLHILEWRARPPPHHHHHLSVSPSLTLGLLSSAHVGRLRDNQGRFHGLWPVRPLQP